LPRQKYTQLQQRSNSVMAQPLNGCVHECAHFVHIRIQTNWRVQHVKRASGTTQL
jgi:hypothetical protein